MTGTRSHSAACRMKAGDGEMKLQSLRWREDKDPALTGRLHPVRSFVHAALLEEAFGFSQKTMKRRMEGGRDQIG